MTTEKATDEPVKPQEACDRERYCDRLAFVLIHSPQSMPWVLNPVKMALDDQEVKAVTILAGKDTPYAGKQLLIEYCPFCREDISPHKKVEKPKLWTPFGKKKS